MPNYRLLVAEPIITHNNLTLSKNHSQHLCKVLRLKEGEVISVFHPDYGEFTAELIEAHTKAAIIHIKDQIHPAPQKPKCHLHLAQCISRGDRMDYAIQKATELGVHEITPIYANRCGKPLPKERIQKRLQHWQGIIDSAVQQCGRIDSPKLNEPLSLDAWLDQNKNELALAALVSSKNDALKNIQSKPNSVSILIGPEGGFTPEEETLLQNKGTLAWQLGPRVLRTETASVVALTLLQTQFGDFN